jgi:cytochrome c oxidase assembly protein subunit 11
MDSHKGRDGGGASGAGGAAGGADAPDAAVVSGGRRFTDRRIAALLVLAAASMGGLAYASVPLYRLFCQVTGYGGTTQRAEAPLAAGPEATEALPDITVRFSADVARDLDWDFRPEALRAVVRPGEPQLAWFLAANRGETGVVGQATFNVTPAKAGQYFHKVQCFCFNEQPLAPGEEARMDVQYFVDPELLRDPATREIRTITLAYTFHYYEAMEEEDEAHGHDHSTHDHGPPPVPLAGSSEGAAERGQEG